MSVWRYAGYARVSLPSLVTSFAPGSSVFRRIQRSLARRTKKAIRMSSKLGRRELLERSWTEVAQGYQQLFVPRFMPWALQTIQAFIDAKPPAGVVVVPCCGPGHELEILANRLPPVNTVVGIDLSEGMVQLAQQRIQQLGLSHRAEARTGDASSLGVQGVAGVVSVFGLQQIPEPHAVLAAWTKALRPGGVLSVCYWGQEVEEDGPWKRIIDLTVVTRLQGEWEREIPGAAVAEGAEVVQDCRPAHEMAWPSVEEFWEGMTRHGPWHSRLLQYGEGHMEGLRREFMGGYPHPQAPLTHTPSARLVVLRRRQPAAHL